MGYLRIENLSKHYGQKQALRDFSACFTAGIYALLGTNGAGKSTLMNIITRNVCPDSGGTITWNGTEIVRLGTEYLAKIGYMPQQQGLYNNFTAYRFLGYMASLKGLKRREAALEIPRALELVELTDVAAKRIGGFSGGMKQRLLIAQAILGKPEIVILDEPTAGLDPKQRVRIRSLIQSLAEDKIVIVSTHIVSDVESIADQVLLLKDGVLAAQGAVEELAACLPVGCPPTLENIYMQYFGDEGEAPC